MTNPYRTPDEQPNDDSIRIIDPNPDTRQDPGKDDRDRDQVTQPVREVPTDGQDQADGEHTPIDDAERDYDQN